MLNNTKVIEEQSSEKINYKELALKYLETLELKPSDSFITTFCETVESCKLNPFLKEVYAIVYRNKDNEVVGNIVTGYTTYIKRAERTGKLDGWEVSFSGQFPNVSATITIYRKDWNRPFKHTVMLKECADMDNRGNFIGTWRKMPRFMCEKVVISQGFRLCFPDELAGIPYSQDELPQEYTKEDVSNSNTLDNMGLTKASELPKQEPKKQTIQEMEQSLKGGPSSPEEKSEIDQLLHYKNADGTNVFSKEEIRQFCIGRRELFSSQDLIRVLKEKIAERQA